MKRIKKLVLKKSDFFILNSNELRDLRGGERTKIGCKIIHKVYECVNFEFNCPDSFTTGDCGLFNTTCTKDFTLSTF